MVLNIASEWLWRCSSEQQLELYLDIPVVLKIVPSTAIDGQRAGTFPLTVAISCRQVLKENISSKLS